MEHYYVSSEGIQIIEPAEEFLDFLTENNQVETIRKPAVNTTGNLSGNLTEILAGILGTWQEDGFFLSICPFAEWNNFGRSLMKKEANNTDKTWGKIRLIENDEKMKTNKGFLAVRPRYERIYPNLLLTVYRDVDIQGWEYAVRFLMLSSPNLPEHLILMRTPVFEQQQLLEWVQDGLVRSASDLTNLLGRQILEHHQECMELFEDQMNSVEEGILNEPNKWQQAEIILLHKQIIGLKKSLNAHESVFSRMATLDTGKGAISWQELMKGIQRELENVRQTHELIESLREAYQTAIDNKANDIMKILTLLATILLPINLLTSFFGMNFEHMPLIHSAYGIVFFYLASLIILVVVLLMFWRKRWL